MKAESGSEENAVERLLETFRSMRAKFGDDFINVLAAVNGLDQFKV